MKNQPTNESSVAIIGAGICGLTIANLLSGYSIYVVEKAKSVGGRMATRRDGNFTYDHGAQFYRNSKGEDFLWHDRWSKKSLSQSWFENDQGIYFCARAGMTSLAKDLAAGQNIFFEQKL